MAALARGRTRLSLLPILLCLALSAGGCNMVDKDGTSASELPGVELIEQPGAGVAAWSPDGRWIAFPSPEGIGLKRADGTEERMIEAPPITANLGRPAPIEWSREDDLLRYVTTNGPELPWGPWITRVRPDGSDVGQARLLSANEERPDEPVLSADGRSVAFKRHASGGSELWVADADGSDQRRLAHFLYLRHYRFSPDNRRIAFTAGGWDGGLYTVSTGGGEPRLVTRESPVGGPSWTPDGRWLTFSDRDGEVRRIRPNGSGAGTIADFDGEEVRGLVWSPNGRYLLYSARPFPNEYFD